MNWEHLRTFIWLRWRLLTNTLRRAGFANAILLAILMVGVLALAIPLFFISLFLGLYGIPMAQPIHLLYAWDAIVAAFLVFWLVGLATELQRSEPVSLSNFLHLPVSVSAVFLLNYLGSLVRLSLIVFAPVMAGFGLALVISKGWPMLFVLPAVAAFLLMVTAVTYQFQGWLGSLMSNPRRRRTIVMALTIGIVILVQIPNFMNILGVWNRSIPIESAEQVKAALEKMDREAQANGLNPSERAQAQRDFVEARKRALDQAIIRQEQQTEQTFKLVNMILPVGWLPVGVLYAAEGVVLPSILGLLGMASIGAASLSRSYYKTMEQYRGASTNRKSEGAVAAAAPTVPVAAVSGQAASERAPRGSLLEASLPGCSEPVSAVALSALRSLVRSPEGKMMLISPVISTIIFASILWRTRQAVPLWARPWIPIGGVALGLLGVMQIMSNQFGFDRDGFRVFVLSAIRRRDILLGKNIAFAPLSLGVGAVMAVAAQVICPMRLDHFLAMIPQLISMFLPYCLLANLISIYAPIYIAPGSLKASNPKLTTALLQLAVIMVLFPLAEAITFFPLVAEIGLKALGWASNIPVFLLLGLVQCAIVVLIYHVTMTGLGRLLQSREQQILDVVTKRAA
jgi:ABC-2 type transport system permease protein